MSTMSPISIFWVLKKEKKASSRFIFSQRSIHIPDSPVDWQSVHVHISIHVIIMFYFMLFLLIFTHQWHLTVLNVAVWKPGGRFLREESLIVKTLNIQVGSVSLWVRLTADAHVPALCRCDWSGLKWFLCSKRCRGREMGSVCWLLCENKTLKWRHKDLMTQETPSRPLFEKRDELLASL